MAIVKVQSATGNGATLALTGVTAGNALIFWDSFFRAASTGLAPATPTDSNGTFAVSRAGIPATFVGAPDDVGTAIWHEQNAASGTHTVTPEVESGHKATIAEFSGLLTSGLLDVVTDAKTSDSTQTSQVTGTTATTAQADELVCIGLCLAAATGLANVALTDPVSGFTTLQVSQNDATDIAMMHAFKVVSSVGTQAATFNWVDTEVHQGSHADIATFKATTADVTLAISGIASTTSTGFSVIPGTAILDFGAFPGASDASVIVSGQTGIASGSIVEAWIRPVGTPDHSADEHLCETIKVFAHSIIAGTGFTISGFNTNELFEPVIAPRSAPYTTGGKEVKDFGGGKGTRIYGAWTVSWVWV